MTAALIAPPASFTAGDTVKYTRSLSDYPASAGWVMKLHLLGKVSTSVTAVADGDAHSVTLPAATTDPLPAGTYRWVETVEKASERYTVNAGHLSVAQNPVGVTGTAGQSWEEKTLQAIEAVLSNRVTDDVAAYQIAGRAVTKIPLPELLKLKAELETKLAAARDPSSAFGGPVQVKFTAPGA